MGEFDYYDYSEDGKMVYEPIGKFGNINKPKKESITFEGRVEAETLKSYLVEPTIIECHDPKTGGMTWVPKSQIERQDASGDKLYEFTVSAWWYGKKIEDGTFDAE